MDEALARRIGVDPEDPLFDDVDPDSRRSVLTKLFLRPGHLIIAPAPAAVAGILAARDGVFAPVPLAVGFAFFSLVLLVGNTTTYYVRTRRFVEGENPHLVDEHPGLPYAAVSGSFSLDEMRLVVWTLVGLAALCLLYLVAVGGVPALVVGGAAVVTGWGYHHFSSRVTAKLQVPLFVLAFGAISTGGLYYVQAVVARSHPFPLVIPAGTLPRWAILAGVPVGLLIAATKFIDNYTDVEHDRRTGKGTIPATYGRAVGLVVYHAMLLGAYLVTVWFSTATESRLLLAPLLSLPLAGYVSRRMWGMYHGSFHALDVTRERLQLYNQALVLLTMLLFVLGLAASGL
ncbi:MAG: prenyltransferase [Halanaeroarchaeum sp.]